MSNPIFFADRLKRLRAEAGLSQPALAERAGLSVSAVRQFEYGRREPAFGTLVKLAAGLGVSLAAFDSPADADIAAEDVSAKPDAAMQDTRRASKPVDGTVEKKSGKGRKRKGNATEHDR